MPGEQITAIRQHIMETIWVIEEMGGQQSPEEDIVPDHHAVEFPRRRESHENPHVTLPQHSVQQLQAGCKSTRAVCKRNTQGLQRSDPF